MDEDLEHRNYWPSISDLFLTLFIVSIGIVAVVFVSLLPKNNVGDAQALVVAVGNDLEKLRGPINRLRQELELPLVEAGSRPQVAIAALNETSTEAVEKIRSLKERLAKLDGLLARLSGSPEAEAEIRRILGENDQLKQRINLLERDLAKLTDSVGKNPDALKRLVTENEDLKRQLHDKPPIIQISEQKEEYRFESGSSEMRQVFVDGLRNNEFARLSEEIIGRQEEGRVKVDTLEIIGHTDGIAISKKGNLDQKLPDYLAGNNVEMSAFVPGSNNDLGLLRALSVRDQWEAYIATRPEHGVLEKVSVRCYSAGQTVLPKKVSNPTIEDYRSNDSSARRIEMRLTRLGSDL